MPWDHPAFALNALPIRCAERRLSEKCLKPPQSVCIVSDKSFLSRVITCGTSFSGRQWSARSYFFGKRALAPSFLPRRSNQKAFRTIQCSGFPQGYEDAVRIETELQKAIEEENYERAAKLNEELKELSETVPQLRIRMLREKMDKAVAVEDYVAAARFRDMVLEISADALDDTPQRTLAFSWPATVPPDPLSDTTTQGTRVRVRSFFVPNRSSPDDNYYFFAYQINISNESTDRVQVISRHWIITDADGRVEHVRGPGVVGEQPVLEPCKSFEYTSACPIQLERQLRSGEMAGSMHGTFHMLRSDGSSFDAVVGPFALIA